MWSSFEKPADLEQQQANLLANAQDDLKIANPQLPPLVTLKPEATFQVVNQVAKPLILWVVASPSESIKCVTLGYAIELAQSL